MNRAFRYASVSALVVMILSALVGCGFKPNQPTLQSLVVTSTSASMIRGTTQQLLATGQYNNGTTQQLTNQVTWISSNPAIATVSPSGVVTGVATGSVTISASVGAVSGQSAISVEIHLTSIAITGTPSVQRGQTQQLTAMGKYDDGSSAAVTAAWSSSNTGVATVAGGGVVTGVTMGTTTITASAGGFSANTAFNVNGIATGTVNETGGTINVTGSSPVAGASVVVPAGAVEAGTTVTINVDYETTPPGPLPAGVTQSSQVLVLEKNSAFDFKLPLTITIPADATALAAGDVPVVFYWNDTYQNYEPASLVGLDTTNNTVTFQTVHFSKYMAMHQKGGWLTHSPKSVDTGFKPDVDGFFHPTFETYGTTGTNSLGMALYASWFYANKKATDGHGLYSKYLEGNLDLWQDDATARELIGRTYAASALIWAKLALPPGASTLSFADTAQATLTAMATTHVPQVVVLRGTSWSEAVLIFAWDANTQKFQVYDPSFPGATVTLGWDSNGPKDFSKAQAHPSDPLKTAEFHGMSIALASTEFEQLYAGAEAGFDKSLFGQITVNTPALNSDNTAILTDGTNLSVEGTIAGGSKLATHIVYCINGDCSSKPVPVPGHTTFSVPLPALTGTNSIMLIATSEPRNPWQAFVGFKEFKIKIQGSLFFTNAGFESGDFSGWYYETHTWPSAYFPAPEFNAEATAVVTGGAVTQVNITNGGGPYTCGYYYYCPSVYAPLVHFSGGGGTGATATASINASGVVTSVTVTNGGSGYASAPSVGFSAYNSPRDYNPPNEKSAIVEDATQPDPIIDRYCGSDPTPPANAADDPCIRDGSTTPRAKLTQGYVGKRAVRVNSFDDNYHISTVSQTVQVPNIRNPQVRFYWAAVLEDPGHTWCAQPYVEVKVEDLDDLDTTTGKPKLLQFAHYTSPNESEGIYCDLTTNPFFPYTGTNPDYGKTRPPSYVYDGWKTANVTYPYYSTWQVIDWQTVELQGVVGHRMKVTVTAGDCAWGGHGGYVYLDGDE